VLVQALFVKPAARRRGTAAPEAACLTIPNAEKRRESGMEDNERPGEDVFVIRPVGISAGMAVFIAVVMLAAGGTAGWFAHQPSPTQECLLRSDTTRAQAESVKAQLEFATKSEQRLNDLRVQVVTECVKRGGVPVLAGPNVECKMPWRDGVGPRQ
jgi:hypothetical protein